MSLYNLLLFYVAVYSHKVFMMRHCVRSPISMSDLCGDGKHTTYSDYAQNPLPDFGVGNGLCTERGKQIIFNEGKFLFQNKLISPDENLNFIVDASTRDNTTATQLINGMNAWNRVSYAVAGNIWAPYNAIPECSKHVPSQEILVKNLQDNLAAVGLPDEDLITHLQEVLGKTSNPVTALKTSVIQGEGNKVSDWNYWANICGPTNVGHKFAQAFMLEYGSGLEVAWNDKNFTFPDDVYYFYALSMWYQRVKLDPLVLSIKYSDYVTKLLQALDGDETSFFVGHDTDMHAMSLWLNMQWVGPDSYKTHHTPPGSMIMFDVNDGIVEVSFLATDFASKDGTMTSTKIIFPNQSNRISLQDLHRIADPMVRHDCVSPKTIDELPSSRRKME